MDGWTIAYNVSGTFSVHLTKATLIFVVEADLVPPTEDSGMVACSESAELYLLVVGEVLMVRVGGSVIVVGVGFGMIRIVNSLLEVVSVYGCFGGTKEARNLGVV